MSLGEGSNVSASDGAMFHVKHEGLDPADVGVELTPVQESQLRRYEAFLRARMVPRRVIAASDLTRLWSRHILDGLRGAPLVPSAATLAIDLGSGAGLPGIPIAIARPRVEVVLAEPRASRAALLELAVSDLGLSNASVHAGRAQDLTPGADVCLARAFGRPTACWAVASDLLTDVGILLYWAGRGGEVRVEGVRTEAFFTPTLADAGAIVMMTRQ